MTTDLFYEKCMETFETDTECAKALGVSKKYLYEVFESKHNLRMSTIVKWCNVLNIPLNKADAYFFA